MADIQQVVVEWDVPSSPGGVSVLYFDGATDPGDNMAAFRALLQSHNDQFTLGTVATFPNEGKILDAGSGALTGYWSASPPANFQGVSTDEPIPNASQLLLRWRTPTVIGGRRLQGRTFLPGFRSGLTQYGQVDPDVVSFWAASISTFLAAAPGFLIWHRPTGGAGGGFATVTSGSLWSELAVLRHRR